MHIVLDIRLRSTVPVTFPEVFCHAAEKNTGFPLPAAAADPDYPHSKSKKLHPGRHRYELAVSHCFLKYAAWYRPPVKTVAAVPKKAAMHLLQAGGSHPDPVSAPESLPSFLNSLLQIRQFIRCHQAQMPALNHAIRHLRHISKHWDLTKILNHRA